MSNLRWLVKQDGTRVLQQHVARTEVGNAFYGYEDIPSIPEVKEIVKPKIYYVSNPDQIKLAGGDMVRITAWTTPIGDGSELNEIQLVEKIPNSVQVTRKSLNLALSSIGFGVNDMLDELCEKLGLGES